MDASHCEFRVAALLRSRSGEGILKLLKPPSSHPRMRFRCNLRPGEIRLFGRGRLRTSKSSCPRTLHSEVAPCIRARAASARWGCASRCEYVGARKRSKPCQPHRCAAVASSSPMRSSLPGEVHCQAILSRAASAGDRQLVIALSTPTCWATQLTRTEATNESHGAVTRAKQEHRYHSSASGTPAHSKRFIM